ncbi:unnamed protein product [Nezara viridula]|uniref:Uncharacterized protein n=1 Tax=Nezara viridula TaxID=85310 RepID=A0A9P0MUA9_NEZVI|nr:unnamed protein product [Nezara viridula]
MEIISLWVSFCGSVRCRSSCLRKMDQNRDQILDSISQTSSIFINRTTM